MQRAVVVQEALSRAGEPVGLVTTIDGPEFVYAWLQRDGQVRQLPDRDRGPGRSRDVLLRDGLGLLFDRGRYLPDESLTLAQSETTDGVFRLVFESGAVQRLPYEADPTFNSSLEFGVAPDGDRVVVAQRLVPFVPEQPTGETRLQLWWCSFTGGMPECRLDVTGDLAGEGDDAPVQWSPDGTTVAVSHRDGRAVGLLLLDSATGAQLARLDGLLLAGTASWSPNSQRLLVCTFWLGAPTGAHATTGTQPFGWLAPVLPSIHVLDVAQQTLTPLTAVGPRRYAIEKTGQRRIFGWADDHRVLTGIQRGKTMTLEACTLDGLDVQPLMRWTGGRDMYPKVAPMPAEYWLATA